MLINSLQPSNLFINYDTCGASRMPRAATFSTEWVRVSDGSVFITAGAGPEEPRRTRAHRTRCAPNLIIYSTANIASLSRIGDITECGWACLDDVLGSEGRHTIEYPVAERWPCNRSIAEDPGDAGRSIQQHLGDWKSAGRAYGQLLVRGSKFGGRSGGHASPSREW